MILFHDCETFSEIALSDGEYRYSESVEVMVHSWAVDDGPVQVFDATIGDDLPFDLLMALLEADTIVYHRSQFDRTVLRHSKHRIGGQLRPLIIEPERIHDTMVQAMSHGLPGGLDKLCAIFKVPVDLAKDKRGKALIQLFCKPRPKTSKLRRATRETHPVEWQQFLDYAGNDISSMRYLYHNMPRWNYPATEHPLWVLDQKINDRGFKVDLDLARAAIETVKLVKDETDASTQDLTEGRLNSTTQRDRLLEELLLEHGVRLPDLQGYTIKRRLEDPELPEPVKELLANRLMASTTSTSKYNRVLKAVSSDGRLRGSLQFCGAPRTKRKSGRLFQPQNLPRPDMPTGEIEQGIAMMKAGCAHLMMDDPNRLAWNALRGLIVAGRGRKLVQADKKQIEARVLPWLACEQWKLDAFRAFDEGTGPDLYLLGASRILRKPIEEVTGYERQSHGKVPELACLGPRTRVLTSNGVKAIMEVTLDDLLWDGAAWVKHQGLVTRGLQKVLRLDGVSMTPDHLVFTASGWQPAVTVGSSPNILHWSQEIASVSLPSSRMCEDRRADFEPSLFNAPAAPSRTKLTTIICATVRRLAALLAVVKLNVPRSSSGGSTLPLFPIRSIDGDYAAEFRRALIDATTPRTKTTTTTELEASTYCLNGAKIEVAFWLIWLRWKAGINRCLNWIASTITKVMNRETCVSSQKSAISAIAEPSKNLKDASLSWSETFDLAHAGPLHRFTILCDSGPLIVHNCGYGGSVGAFHSMAKIYDIRLSDSEAHEIVRAWRETNNDIANWTDGFWVQLDQAARMAIRHPNQTFEAGPYIRFERWRNWLRMELPSGGFLSYASPEIVADPRRPGNDAISFWGINNYTRKWERLYTYGGRISADATQATARDIFYHNMPLIEESGYPIVMEIHDEVITEPLDNPNHSVEGLLKLIGRRPPWIDDKLPLAAGGFEAYRYKKED